MTIIKPRVVVRGRTDDPIARVQTSDTAESQPARFSGGMWAIILFVSSEAMFFAALFTTYFYLRTRLPDWEPVYAMTIHKSQGSEFDRVAVVLPRSPSANEARLLTRELVYTAVTRARSRVHLFATHAVLALALGAQTQRASGLRELLWASPQR